MPTFRQMMTKRPVPTFSDTQVPESLVRIRDAETLRVPGLPLVTIVSVVRNAEATLERAIDSLRQQTYPAIEHVIIDGASTDGTREIIQSHLDWVAAWSSQPDGGLYDAMNQGIVSASGDLIGILNADDWFEPDFVEKSINALTESSGDFVFANIWMHGYRGRDLYLPGDPDYARVVRRDVPKTWHTTMMCKRHMYEQIGLYRTDMKIASDYDFQIRAFNAGLLGVYAQGAIAHVAAGGVSTTVQHLALREGFLCSVWNGYPIWKALPHWTLRWITTDFPIVDRFIYSVKCSAVKARHTAARYAKRLWDTLGPLKPYIPGKSIAMKMLGVAPAVALSEPAVAPTESVVESVSEQIGEPIQDQVRLAAFIEARHEGVSLSDHSIEAIIHASKAWSWYTLRGDHQAVPALRALLCAVGIECVDEASRRTGAGLIIDTARELCLESDTDNDSIRLYPDPPPNAVRLCSDGLCFIRAVSSCAV